MGGGCSEGEVEGGGEGGGVERGRGMWWKSKFFLFRSERDKNHFDIVVSPVSAYIGFRYSDM